MEALIKVGIGIEVALLLVGTALKLASYVPEECTGTCAKISSLGGLFLFIAIAPPVILGIIAVAKTIAENM